jgi:urease accessory protein
VINKTDLALYLNADLNVMERDIRKMRGDKAFIFRNLKRQSRLADIVKFVSTNIC